MSTIEYLKGILLRENNAVVLKNESPLPSRREDVAAASTADWAKRSEMIGVGIPLKAYSAQIRVKLIGWCLPGILNPDASAWTTASRRY